MCCRVVVFLSFTRWKYLYLKYKYIHCVLASFVYTYKWKNVLFLLRMWGSGAVKLVAKMRITKTFTKKKKN